MNLGFPGNLKKKKKKNTFNNVIPTPRPEILFEEIPNPYWFVRVCGDGCFIVSVSKS